VKKARFKVYNLLNLKAGKASYWVDYILLGLIIINCGAIIIESVKSIGEAHAELFYAIEYVSIVVFSIEYLLRVWSIVEDPNYRHPVWGRLRFIFTGGALIDLLAILPFYLAVLTSDLLFVRVFRLLRILRLLKVARYIHALELINTVWQKRRAHLFITLVLLLFMLIVSSALMYYVEHPSQPDKFSSIPETMWWGLATLTTIGYGDMYPITTLGKLLAAVISIVGIGLFALPTGIFASGFVNELSKHEEEKKVCPHCGKTHE
jgi:voltage-gated potassium channel